MPGNMPGTESENTGKMAGMDSEGNFVPKTQPDVETGNVDSNSVGETPKWPGQDTWNVHAQHLKNPALAANLAAKLELPEGDSRYANQLENAKAEYATLPPELKAMVDKYLNPKQ